MRLRLVGLSSRVGSICTTPTYMNNDTFDTDIIHFFNRTQPSNLRNTAMVHILLSDRPKLMPRPWRMLRPHNPEEEPFVRVLSWNVLAQALAEAVDNFPRDDRTLEWRERRFYLLQEITEHNPDVICLQEVDHYLFLNASLGCSGYISEFLKKPDSPCLHVEGNNGPDGVALFYKSDKFDCLAWETRTIEILGAKTNQVVLGAVLKSRINSVELFVAVTHLKAKSSALMALFRDYQGEDLLKWVKKESGNRPVILCGDFNAEPGEAVYERIMNHNLNLKSAYRINGSEPEYTTWKMRSTGEEKKTVDYIFHSNTLIPLQVVDLPKADHVAEKKFPNETYPSDHLSLVVDFGVNQNCVVEAEDTV